jgi:AcrR family transcriptional regulator
MTEEVKVDPRVERTKARVLEATRTLLVEGGQAGISHSALAARAGVGRATLYRHWPRLDQLFAELIADLGERFEIEMVGDLGADLRAALQSMALLFSSPEGRAPILAAIERAQRSDNAARQLMCVLGSTTAARHVLDRAIDQGQLSADLDLDLATSLLLGPVMHRAFMTRDPVDAPFIDAVVDAFLAWHQRGHPGQKQGRQELQESVASLEGRHADVEPSGVLSLEARGKQDD